MALSYAVHPRTLRILLGLSKRTALPSCKRVLLGSHALALQRLSRYQKNAASPTYKHNFDPFESQLCSQGQPSRPASNHTRLGNCCAIEQWQGRGKCRLVRINFCCLSTPYGNIQQLTRLLRASSMAQVRKSFSGISMASLPHSHQLLAVAHV